MTTQGPNTGPSVEEGVFSLEDLDKIIAVEDPNFLTEMEDIKAVGVGADTQIDSLDPDQVPEAASGASKDRGFKERCFDFVIDYKAKISGFFKHRIFLLKTNLVKFILATKQYIRHELPERIKFYRVHFTTSAKSGVEWFRSEIAKFKALQRKEKAGLLFMVMASIASILVLSKTWTGAWLPTFSDPLMGSFSEGIKETFSFKDKSELQNLFNAFPEVEFSVLLKKVVVNLKPDPESSSNPMGLYEVFLSLDSQDTAVEVKDREREILDTVQRALEPFTYSEVISRLGKDRMKAAIKDRVNERLNQGKVFHVYFNNFVTKP